MDKFSKDFEDRLLGILEKVLDKKESLSDADAIIYFHWANNIDDPAYGFVPERYRKYNG